jgi:hypothetical protein
MPKIAEISAFGPELTNTLPVTYRLLKENNSRGCNEIQ